tara:strand:+ start:3644 stop:4789 length:1146 start_codon:yes stop_codon:yes gene_type:complete
MSEPSSGSSKTPKTIGKNYFALMDDYYLQYPVQRSTDGGEDSLLIQCVDYKPPSAIPYDVKAKYQQKYDDLNDNDVKDANENFVKDSEPTTSFEIDISESGINSTGGIYDTHSSEYSGNDFSTETHFYVELPIPQSVRDANGCVWEGNSMNIFTAAGLALASNMMEAPGMTISTATQVVQNAMSGSGSGNLIEQVASAGGVSTTDIKNNLRAALAGLAVNQFGANVTPNTVMARSNGQILNSNKELLFNGTKLREFAFQFTFTPRDAGESEQARKIIRKMKQAMSPGMGKAYSESKKQALFLNSPKLFLLRYLKGGEDHPFLNSFKPCALTEFAVDYTGTGAYATYGDGTPVHMKVSMKFKETNPIYAEDYDKENLSGVGY